MISAGNNSKEAHAKQRAVAKERKLAKPNADSIQRAKKLWEKLRRKSHVLKDERQKLVAELFEIITGRVKDFVFKHDSVRTIQCALKYASPAQRKIIATELKGEYRALAESRYSKFLVGKILVEGDEETRDMVISEFYGHVRRLINHPEASWILDDTYRQVATKAQKAILLREWYGPEYAIFKTPGGTQQAKEGKLSADLPQLLTASPEKRRPILQYLFNLINQLVQKKLTAFTMLHDAMLQYSLAISMPASTTTTTNPSTTEAPPITTTTNTTLQNSLLALLLPTEETDLDLLLNLAFTPSGARLLTRTLATAPTAKDRKLLLRAYKDHVETLACDPNGACVLFAAFECVDDTVMLSRLVFPELLAAKIVDQAEKSGAVVALAGHLVGRVVLLWVLASSSGDEGVPRRLVTPDSQTAAIVAEVRHLRVHTSKKQPETRRAELAKALLTTADNAVLTCVEHKAGELASTPFGCHFIIEVLLAASAHGIDCDNAVQAVVALANGDPNAEGHISRSVAGSRMLKTLVQGGRFDPVSKTVTKVLPPPVTEPNASESGGKGLSAFPTLLWSTIRPHLEAWATGPGSFVIVALAEDEGEGDGTGDEDGFEGKGEFLDALLGMLGRLEGAANGAVSKLDGDVSKLDGEAPMEDGVGKGKGRRAGEGEGGNKGAHLLVNMLT